MMHILCCGDRDWDDRRTIYFYLWRVIEEHNMRPSRVIVVHGGARGADEQAAEVAKEIGCDVRRIKAKWSKQGRAAGPIRNSLMLSKYPYHRVLAFHNNIRRSKGTIDMVKKANAKGIFVMLIPSLVRRKRK